MSRSAPLGCGLEGVLQSRRDVLKGLSTVPALGLFGYAWQQQRHYQQAKLEAASAAPAASADLQEINVALVGAGAQGQVLTEAMLRIPGLRFGAPSTR